MRILFTIYSLEVGGAQTFMIRLANELAKNHTVFIYDHHPCRSESALKDQVDKRVKVISFNPRGVIDFLIWKINRLCKFFFIEYEFRARIKDEHYKFSVRCLKPDLISSHSFYSDCKAAFKTPNVPLVISMHGEYEMAEYNADFLRKAFFALRKSDSVIYVADKNLKVFNYIPKVKTSRKKIYYGFSDTFGLQKKNHSLNIDPETFIFGMVARGMKEKGWMHTIEAFELTKRMLPDHKLALVLVSGTDEYIEAVEKECKTQDDIYFTGFSPHPLEWIRLFDVALLPTYFAGESLPNSIIEYLYAGKPVVATAIGEIPNMIKADGELAGFIVELKSDGKPSPADISAAMLQYLTYPDLLERQRKIALKAFEKFDMKICLNAYQEVFRQVLKDNIK